MIWQDHIDIKGIHIKQTKGSKNMSNNQNPSVKPTAKQNFVQSVKFLLFSISAGVIQVASFALLENLTEWGYWPCYLTSLVLSVLWNFTLNRRFTFKSAANVPIAMIKVFGFYCVFTPLSTIAGEWAAQMGVNEYIVLAVTMVLNFVLEFLFCRLFVYRNEMYTNDLGQAELSRMDNAD